VTPRLWRLLLAGSVVVQLVALYWPQQVGGGGPPGTDKLVHALLFAAVAFTGRFAGVPVRWLAALLAAHLRGETIVGGALDLPPGLSYTARCDYYCGWYLSHSRRPDGRAPALPGPHVSGGRAALHATSPVRGGPPVSN
jgi:hypothetical protein